MDTPVNPISGNGVKSGASAAWRYESNRTNGQQSGRKFFGYYVEPVYPCLTYLLHCGKWEIGNTVWVGATQADHSPRLTTNRPFCSLFRIRSKFSFRPSRVNSLIRSERPPIFPCLDIRVCGWRLMTGASISDLSRTTDTKSTGDLSQLVEVDAQTAYIEVKRS